jgi:hypothetical protein
MRVLDVAAGAGTWSSLSATGPAPRSAVEDRGLLGSRAALDAGENLMIAVCDCQNGSTHFLDLTEGRWSPAPNDRPMPFSYPVFVYDAAGDRAILIGGEEEFGEEFSTRVWAYDLSPARSGWRDAGTTPFRILHQAADIDPASRHVLLFGGQTDRALETDALWRLDLGADGAAAWSELTPEGVKPSARMGASLTFLGDSGTAVLFGGYSRSGELAETWLLDYTDPEAPVWQPLALTGGPSGRSGHSAVWDPVGERVLIYGGVAGSTSYLDETWAFSLSTAAPTPTDEPSATPTTPTPTEPMPTTTAPVPTTPRPSDTPDPGDGEHRIYLPRAVDGA